MKRDEQAIKEERRLVLEMINDSWCLAERLGKHKVKRGCGCISCVNKRKRIIKDQEREWKFRL